MMVHLTPVVVLLVVLERLRWTRRSRIPFFRQHFISDVAFLLFGWVAGAGLALRYVEAAAEVLKPWTGRPLSGVPLSAAIVVGVVLLDLGNFAVHRLHHRVESLWQVHKVHHALRELDWMATFHSHLLEQTLRRLVAPVLLILLGAPAMVVVTSGLVVQGFAVLNHANVRGSLFRWMEPIFITPRLHRLHHVAASADCNFGTVFSLWDRAFGTLRLHEEADGAALGVPTGVAGEAEPYPLGFLAAMVEPLRSGLRRRTALSK